MGKKKGRFNLFEKYADLVRGRQKRCCEKNVFAYRRSKEEKAAGAYNSEKEKEKGSRGKEFGGGR